MSNIDTQSTSGKDLAPHIQQFNVLTQKLDEAVKNKDATVVDATKQELDIFFGQLESKQQMEIWRFLELQRSGQSIQEYRSTYRGRFYAVLNGVGSAAKTTAHAIPQLAEETVRLLVATLGHIGAGAWKGGVSTYQAFNQAA
jgi:hypothetical protein